MGLSIEQINRLEQENAELKARTQILSDELDKYKSVVFKQLEEIERLKLSERDLSKICQGLKYYKTLQEIKKIAEENKATAQYGGICKSILDLITKAEEE